MSISVGPAETARKAIARDTGNPLVAVACPALLKPKAVLTRVDQQIAALRLIEALRDCAARYDGNPPASLDLITDLPVSVDPTTGNGLRYVLNGRVATLDAPTPEGVRAPTGDRYELTFVAGH